MRALMPRWSPDGKQIAFMGSVEGNHWTNYLISADGGVAQQLVSGDELFADPTWAPDGKSIVFRAVERSAKVEASMGST